MSVSTKIKKTMMKNNISNKLVSGNNVGVKKDPKITTQKMKNNFSNKLVSWNDIGVDKDLKKTKPEK